MFAEQTGLHQQHQKLRMAARQPFRRLALGPQPSNQRRGRIAQTRVLAAERRQVFQQCLHGLRFPADGTHHVQRHHIARSFPDRNHRCFAIQAAHRAFIHIAVTAKDLHGLARQFHAALGQPELGRRRDDALVGTLQRIIIGQREGLGQPHHHQRGGFGFERHVGQHVAHQRLIDQRLAERATVAGMVQRLDQALANQAGTAHHAVQARESGHFDDGGNTTAFLADHAPPGTTEFHLAAGVGTIAHLVLQPLDLHCVLGAIGPVARHVEAGRAAFRAGHHEVRVAHRRREEPLVAGDQVLAAAPLATQRFSARGVGPHVGATLLLRHAHADEDRVLLFQRDIPRIVRARIELRRERCEQFGFALQYRNARESHRVRALRARLDLPVHRESGRIGSPCAGTRIGERLCHEVLLARHAHDAVPARVKLHTVDTAALAVERMQLGLEVVGLLGHADRLGAAKPRAVGGQLGFVGARPRAAHRLLQGKIGGVDVIILQFRHHVGDLVRAPFHGHVSVAPARQSSRSCRQPV